jgi:amidohydrolase
MDVHFNKHELINLRKTIHKYPELSGKEKETPRRIINYISKFNPDRIIENIGKTGLAVIFEGKAEGPTILFRCDLDALPIQEVNEIDYKSVYKNIAHKCGHDGHMAIMSGFAEVISQNRPRKGRVVLLYQPSEENGQGAEMVIKDNQFKEIEPDYVFALHNLPGYSKSSIISRKGTFAAGSKGMINRLYGKTAHAGEPENGNSPALAMADIVSDLSFLPKHNSYFEDFTLITIIHARLGEIAFGTTPGYAEVMATLRTYSNDDMNVLTQRSLEIVDKHIRSQKLRSETEWVEEFPATINNEECVDLIEEVAKNEGLDIFKPEEPLRWSEDFSQFTIRYPGALFGLGSGTEQPQLHNPDYNFPDEIIEAGIKVFYGIYKKYLQ